MTLMDGGLCEEAQHVLAGSHVPDIPLIGAALHAVHEVVPSCVVLGGIEVRGTTTGEVLTILIPFTKELPVFRFDRHTG